MPAAQFTDEQFSALIDALRERPSGDIDRVLDAIAAGNKALQDVATTQQRAVRHSNAFHPGISAYSYPEGDEKRIKPRHVDKTGRPREVFFCGTRQDEEMLTPREIDLYNQITSSKLARNGDWRADVQQLGPSGERLLIQIPVKTINDKARLPQSLEICLLEFIGGRDAVDPMRLTEEVQQQRDTIAALVAQVAALQAAAKVA